MNPAEQKLALQVLWAAAQTFSEYLFAGGLCAPEIYGQTCWFLKRLDLDWLAEDTAEVVSMFATLAAAGEGDAPDDTATKEQSLAALAIFKAEVAAHLAEGNCHLTARDTHNTKPPQLGSSALDFLN